MHCSCRSIKSKRGRLEEKEELRKFLEEEKKILAKFKKRHLEVQEKSKGKGRKNFGRIEEDF